MLIWIFVWIMIALACVSIGVAIYSKKMWQKIICLILSLTLFILPFITVSVKNKAFKGATVSNIEIEEVYKDENNFYYIRKTGETDLLRLKPDKIYLGNSNYVIKYEYPNMTDGYAYWLEEEPTQYDLVLTDLNVKDLPDLN